MASHRIVDSEKVVSKKACPLSTQAKKPSLPIPINILKQPWLETNRIGMLWILTMVIGIMTILLVWAFPPYTVYFTQEIYNFGGYSKYRSSYAVSILWSCGPVLVYLAVAIGLISGLFIRLYEEKAIRYRLSAGAILGSFLSFAILLDYILLQLTPILSITQIVHYQTGSVTTYEITPQVTLRPQWLIQIVLLTLPGMLLIVVPSMSLLAWLFSLIGDWWYYYFSGRGWWGRSYPVGYGGTILFRKTGELSSYVRYVKHPERTHEPRDNLKRELIWFKKPMTG